MFNVYKKGLSNAFLPNNFTSVLKLCLKHRVRFVNHRARHAQAAVFIAHPSGGASRHEMPP